MSSGMYVFVSCIILLLSSGADGHAFLNYPKVRNRYADCPQCLAVGGPGTVFESNTYKHGMCGNSKDDEVQNWNRPGPIQATFVEGQAIDLEIVVTAHHMGYFDFQVCDSQDISEECFAAGRLMRVGCTDPSDIECFRAWKPLVDYESGIYIPNTLNYNGPVVPTTESRVTTYKYRMVLPQGVICSHCVLRFHYFTTNSCTRVYNPDQIIDDGFYSEEFFNCADIEIQSKDGGAANTPNTQATTSEIQALLDDQPRDLYDPSLRNLGMYYTCPEVALGSNDLYDTSLTSFCYSVGQTSCTISSEQDNSNPNPNPNPTTTSTSTSTTTDVISKYPDSSIRCGTSWVDADSKCGESCITDEDCPNGEGCYAGCSLDILCASYATSYPAATTTTITTATSSTVSVPANPVINNPLEITSIRCGANYFDADSKCGQSCTTDNDCPDSEKCYAGCTLDVCQVNDDVTTTTTTTTTNDVDATTSPSSVRCGVSWVDADFNCGKTCANDGDCPGNTKCFADLRIDVCNEDSGNRNSFNSEDSESTSTSKSSQRCGTDWFDADSKCGDSCTSKDDCPGNQNCYAGCSLDVC